MTLPLIANNNYKWNFMDKIYLTKGLIKLPSSALKAAIPLIFNIFMTKNKIVEKTLPYQHILTTMITLIKVQVLKEPNLFQKS